MNFLLFILIIFIGMFIKKAKWFDFLAILFLGMITYLGDNVADFENYQQAYNYISSGNEYIDLGTGWFYLCKIGAMFNLTYLQFKTILIVVSILIMNSAIKYFIKDNKYKPFIWSLYLIFPALLDCIQIRFFLAMAIILYGLRFLLGEQKRDIIKYVLVVLIASIIHSSMLLYLIFLLYKLLGKNELKYIMIIVISMFAFLMFKDQIINICSIFINSSRIQRYFYSTDSLGIKGIITYVSIIIIFYYISNIMINKIKNEKKEITFFRFVAKLNILISIVLVFSIFDPNFFRLQRIMWILMYICALKLLDNDIRVITFLGLKLPVKLLFFLLALTGNIIFIVTTNSSIIQNFLF